MNFDENFRNLSES